MILPNLLSLLVCKLSHPLSLSFSLSLSPSPSHPPLPPSLSLPLPLSLLQETEDQWLNYTADQPVSLLKEVFPMTIKGIARSCLGDVFESREEVDKLAESYHKCWSEMEVKFIVAIDPNIHCVRSIFWHHMCQVSTSPS